MIQAVVIGATAIICIGVIITLFNRERAAQAQRSPYDSDQRPPGPSSYINGQVRNRRFRPLSELECVVCLENPPEVETYPCGHRILCEACLLRLITECKKSCPVCRRDIKGYHTVSLDS